MSILQSTVYTHTKPTPFPATTNKTPTAQTCNLLVLCAQTSTPCYTINAL